MNKMKMKAGGRVYVKWLVVCVVLAFCLHFSSAWVNAKSDKFVYNGKNMYSYQGQSVLVIDKRDLNAKDTRLIYQYRYRLTRVKTIQYSDKVVSVTHDFKQPLYAACPNVTKLIYGKKLKSDESDYNQINYDGHSRYEVLGKLEKLKTIQVKKGNKKYRAQDGVLYYNKEIKYWYGQQAGKKLVIPDGIKCLHTEYYEGKVDNVKTLVLNKDLRKIWYDGDVIDAEQGLDVLHVFPNLEKVVVPKANKNFFVQDGCLYQRKSGGIGYTDDEEAEEILSYVKKMKKEAIANNEAIPEVCTKLDSVSVSSKEYFYKMVGYIKKSGCTDIQIPDCVRNYETDWLAWHSDMKFTLRLPKTMLYYMDWHPKRVEKLIIDEDNFMYYSDGKKAHTKYKVFVNKETGKKELGVVVKQKN